MAQTANRINNISSLIKTANKNLRKAQMMLESLERDMQNSFEDVPGVLGVFDGENMITAEGKTYDINPNYVAKSMLVVGDNLKMVEENGKQLFKQVTKVPRKELKGVLNKKEGKWYVLTDDGSFRVLDVAVEFRRGAVNDEVEVMIPEDNKNTTYAALVKLAKEDERPVIDEEKAAAHKEKKEESMKEEKKETKKAPGKKKTPEKKTPAKEKSEKKPAEKSVKEEPKKAVAEEEPKKEEPKIESIFEEDDLV